MPPWKKQTDNPFPVGARVRVTHGASVYCGRVVRVIGEYKLRTLGFGRFASRKWCYECEHPLHVDRSYYPAHHVLSAHASGFAVWARKFDNALSKGAET